MSRLFETDYLTIDERDVLGRSGEDSTSNLLYNQKYNKTIFWQQRFLMVECTRKQKAIN